MGWTGAFLDGSLIGSFDPKYALTMDTVWGRTLASSPTSKWSPSSWTPHLVVILIGHNDFKP